MDAKRFVNNAKLFVSDEMEYVTLVGATIYEYFLSLIFRVSDHLIFAINISNIAFLTSVLIILKIFNLLQVTKRIQFISLIIILLYPSLLLHTVTTLREPFQFLFLTLFAYFYLKIVYERFRLSYLILMSISIILFGLLHNGLLGFIPIIFIIVTFGLLKTFQSINNKFIVILYGIFILNIIFILVGAGYISSNMVDSIVEGEAIEYAESYRENVPDVRSSYNSIVNLSNPIIAILTISDAVIKYFTFPLPWHMSSVKDIVTFIENAVRLYLIYYIIKNRKFIGHLKPVLFIFILLEVLWSLGTANWGTASRHHIVQSQLLLIIFASVIDRFKKEN